MARTWLAIRPAFTSSASLLALATAMAFFGVTFLPEGLYSLLLEDQGIPLGIHGAIPIIRRFSNMSAMSVGVMANWLANFVVSETFPGLVGISLGLAYGLFTLGALVSFFYVWKFVKETKGVQLEDMESLEGVEFSK